MRSDFFSAWWKWLDHHHHLIIPTEHRNFDNNWSYNKTRLPPCDIYMLCCSFKSCEVKCSLQDVSAVQCSAYAGSGFWLNANSKRQAQHHVLPNCGRKQAPSSCEPTPRLPPELLPEDLWWAPSPGCPPWKEVRPVLGGQPHFGTKECDKWQLLERHVKSMHWTNNH